MWIAPRPSRGSAPADLDLDPVAPTSARRPRAFPFGPFLSQRAKAEVWRGGDSGSGGAVTARCPADSAQFCPVGPCVSSSSSSPAEANARPPRLRRVGVTAARLVSPPRRDHAAAAAFRTSGNPAGASRAAGGCTAPARNSSRLSWPRRAALICATRRPRTRAVRYVLRLPRNRWSPPPPGAEGRPA